MLELFALAPEELPFEPVELLLENEDLFPQLLDRLLVFGQAAHHTATGRAI